MNSNSTQSMALLLIALACLVAANWCLQVPVQSHLLEMSSLLVGVAARHFVGDTPNPPPPGGPAKG